VGRRKLRSLRAGAVLDSGGQGCIFVPPLYPVKRRFPIVSKVLQKSEAEQEYTVSLALKKLDPRGRYGLYPTAPWHCGVSAAQISANAPDLKPVRDKDSDTCGFILADADRDTYCSIEYERFDSTLKKVIKASKCTGYLEVCPEARATLQSLQDVWRAIAFLRRHNFVHGDLKASNVAKRARGGLFLTDWGWSADLNTAEGVKEQLQLMAQYDDYAIPQYGGREDGIWSPVIWSRGVPALEALNWHRTRQVLLFNDLFSAAYLTQKAIKKMRISVPALEAVLGECIDMPNQLFDAGPRAWSAYEARVMKALKAAQ
jgi:serine/threonine protein kinase